MNENKETEQKNKVTMTKEEALISAKNACYYALFVLRGEFLEGEELISKDAWYSYLYAVSIIKKPFPKGEAVILAEPRFKKLYEDFLKYIVSKNEKK